MVIHESSALAADVLSRTPLAFSSSLVSPPTFHEQAVSFLQSSRFDEALQSLDRASAELMNTLGVTHKMMGNYDKALDSFMSAIRLTDGFHAHYNAANLLHYILYETDQYNKQQVLETAISFYDKALVRAMVDRQVVNGVVSNTIKAQVYFELSEALRKGNRFSESTLALIKAAQFDAKYQHDLGNSVVMLVNEGYIQDAMNAASAAVELDPMHPALKRNYEVLLQEIEKQKQVPVQV